MESPSAEHGASPVGHVRHFAVRPAWTRRGIGRRLFKASVTQAREAGAAGFDVYSALNAIEFYAALGFRDTEIIKIDFGNGAALDRARMRLSELNAV